MDRTEQSHPIARTTDPGPVAGSDPHPVGEVRKLHAALEEAQRDVDSLLELLGERLQPIRSSYPRPDGPEDRDAAATMLGADLQRMLDRELGQGAVLRQLIDELAL